MQILEKGVGPFGAQDWFGALSWLWFGFLGSRARPVSFDVLWGFRVGGLGGLGLYGLGF